MIKTRHFCIAIAAALVGSFAGCYTGPSVGDSLGLADVGDRASRPVSAAREAGAASGLPCDVEALLAARCGSCHSDPPSGGPMPLVTYAQLVAPSVSDPARTVAQAALARMRDPVKPMPPSNPLSANDIAPFASWVLAGTPALGCAPDDVSGPSREAGGPECVLASDCPG